MAGELAGVGAREAFGDGHAAAAVELGPVIGDAARGVVEGHGDGAEDWVPSSVDVTHLHQFTAIDGTVAWQEKVVVGFANVTQCVAHRSRGIDAIRACDHEGSGLLARQERVNGREGNAQFRDGLEGIKRPLVAADTMQDGDMVNGEPIHPLRDLGDGIGLVLRHKEEVAFN